jgi:hypothetical protein
MSTYLVAFLAGEFDFVSGELGLGLLKYTHPIGNICVVQQE